MRNCLPVCTPDPRFGKRSVDSCLTRSANLQQLRGLVRKCWAHEIHDRPDFVEISALLEGIIDKLGPRKPSTGLQPHSKGCCTVQ